MKFDDEETPVEEVPAAAPVEAAPAPVAPAAVIPPKPEPSSAPIPPENIVTVMGQRPPPVNSPELKQEMIGYGQDLDNGHIKPETYHDLYAKKDTLGKIGTLFGLMIGGAGAGLSHQPNALLEMMNKEIGNDLEAQKSSMANKQGFLKLNLEHQMNQAQISRLQKEGVLTEAQAKAVTTEANIKAYALARAQANTSALHYLVQYTNKLPVGSPLRMEAEKKLAFMSQGVQNENFNLADRAAAAGALANVGFNQSQEGGEGDFQGRQNALRISGNAPIAESNEQKHMPGIKGQASIPLTPQDRDEILAGTQFQSQMKRFIDWTKGHSGDLSPSERKEGEALAAQLQGAYRLATKGGVYKEGEQGFISNIIDSTPTKFFNSIRVIPSLQAVQRESATQLDERVKSKGFKGYESSQKSESPKAEQYKTVNGIKYKRGPNGEAIKVK